MSVANFVTLPAPRVDTSATKWRTEYDAFLKMRSGLLASHAGNFVVIHNGEVVDSGPDDLTLALRFFETHGNVPVHIGLVTDKLEAATRVPRYRNLPAGETP